MSHRYDKAVGYSPLECVDERKLNKLVRLNKSLIEGYYLARKGDKVLVAGTGLGHEALSVQRYFGLTTVGVDLNIRYGNRTPQNRNLYFQEQDLANIAFKDDCFALIYCYHVLEHVANSNRVLEEFARVLCPGGILFVGFPNRYRLISYLGSSQKVSSLQKIQWNLNDLLFRLRGKFENQYGAHAGFSENEFLGMVSSLFQKVYPVRNEYMLKKYKEYQVILRWVIRFHLAEIVFPSNYFICVNE